MDEEDDSQVTTIPAEEAPEETQEHTEGKNKNLKARLAELEEAAVAEKARAEDLFKRLQKKNREGSERREAFRKREITF